MNVDGVLAVEISSRRGSLALRTRDGAITTHRLQTDRTHTAELIPAIAALLAAHDLTPRDVALLAISRGPGSFTGIRVACTLAQTWRSATGCRILAPDSLSVVAAGIERRPDPPARLCVALDARQQRVFVAEYTLDATGPHYRVAAGPQVLAASDWLAGLGPETAVTGDAIATHAAGLAERGIACLDESGWLPEADALLDLALRTAANSDVDDHPVAPLYLRVPECEEVYEARRAAAIERRRSDEPG